MAEWVCHLPGTQEVVRSTPRSSPVGGTVAIKKVVRCMGLSVALATEDPLGSIKKNRALCSGPGFLSQPNITISVCERAVKPDSIKITFLET